MIEIVRPPTMWRCRLGTKQLGWRQKKSTAAHDISSTNLTICPMEKPMLKHISVYAAVIMLATLGSSRAETIDTPKGMEQSPVFAWPLEKTVGESRFNYEV